MTSAESATWALKRVGNRAWRQTMTRVPPVGWAVTQRHSRRVRAYSDQIAPIPPRQNRLLEDIAVSGVAVTHLDALGLSGTDSLKEPLERLAGRLAERRSTKPYPLCSSRAELLEEIGVWQWGLREDVLDLVEGYLQLPARYYGPEVRREIVDGRQKETRQWHLDVEDHRVFRLLVWIRDVGPMGGAFEWIPRDQTSVARQGLRYVSGYRTERQMTNLVPHTQWKQAFGPRWTAVLADTHSVFHRAGTPHDIDRYSVMFTWTSQWPVKTMRVRRFSPSETAKVQQGLNPRQRAALAPVLLAR